MYLLRIEHLISWTEFKVPKLNLCLSSHLSLPGLHLCQFSTISLSNIFTAAEKMMANLLSWSVVLAAVVSLASCDGSFQYINFGGKDLVGVPPTNR